MHISLISGRSKVGRSWLTLFAAVSGPFLDPIGDMGHNLETAHISIWTVSLTLITAVIVMVTAVINILITDVIKILTSPR